MTIRLYAYHSFLPRPSQITLLLGPETDFQSFNHVDDVRFGRARHLLVGSTYIRLGYCSLTLINWVIFHLETSRWPFFTSSANVVIYNPDPPPLLTVDAPPFACPPPKPDGSTAKHDGIGYRVLFKDD